MKDYEEKALQIRLRKLTDDPDDPVVWSELDEMFRSAWKRVCEKRSDHKPVDKSVDL